VGAWGPGLFSDDLACDVRGEYREMIEDGVPDEEATHRILERYKQEAADPDDGATFWLALAFTQSKIGRLDPSIRDHALQVIERGEGLHMWQDDPKLLAKRKAVLEKIRIQITGRQPPRRKLRKPKGQVTDLVPGDVILLRAANRCALLRVARLHQSRIGVIPVLVALDFEGTEPPPPEELRTLPDRPERKPKLLEPRPWDHIRFSVQSFQKIDYRNAGFERLGRIESRAGDESVPVNIYTHWSGLAVTLKSWLGAGADASR